MFVRFVVGADSENQSRLLGVLTEAHELMERGELFDHEAQTLTEALGWFNDHLPVPPFRAMQRSGKWTDRAVCWFRPEAREPIAHVWDVVAILKEHGTPVRLLATDRPGRVVFEDRFQIVAEPPYWA